MPFAGLADFGVAGGIALPADALPTSEAVAVTGGMTVFDGLGVFVGLGAGSLFTAS
jgi:hypothetical protein